jgi:hypothetical protein
MGNHVGGLRRQIIHNPIYLKFCGLSGEIWLAGQALHKGGLDFAAFAAVRDQRRRCCWMGDHFEL